MFSCMWHSSDQPFTERGAIYSGTTDFSRYLYLAGLVSAHLPCLLCLLQSNFSEEAMAHCSHCSCFFSQNAIVSSTLPATASRGSKAISSEGQESSGQGFDMGLTICQETEWKDSTVSHSCTQPFKGNCQWKLTRSIHSIPSAPPCVPSKTQRKLEFLGVIPLPWRLSHSTSCWLSIDRKPQVAWYCRIRPCV